LNEVEEINKIDVGSVLSIEDHFLSPDSDEHVRGCYRDLRSYLPRLASFYLKTQGSHKESLKWFGETEGTFIVALGGDGCRFGKNDTACSFLASFLNTGKRVASSNDNFLIFGANCEETSKVVHKYIQELCKQIDDLKGKIFEINGLHVTFKFQELPNDMKMLAMLGGELSNAATYFSSFANVSKNDCTDVTGKFGSEPGCKWKPWSYSDRLKTVKAVDTFKKPLTSQAITEKSKRSKVTEFIAKQNSRQEFTPLLGKLIDTAHVEPLHLKNNAWQYFFKSLLKEAVAKTSLSASKQAVFADLAPDCCLARVVTSLQYEVKAKRLAGKVKKWFDETQGKKLDISYRFTGKESRLFCHNFMRLIKYLSCENDNQKQRQTVLTLVYIGLRLRDCCSIFNRFEVKEKYPTTLQTLAIEYFRANAMFLPSSINPTIWTLGHVVPVHARAVYNTYKQGLLTVTMEGREAKHIFLHRLSVNTSYRNRWYEIFKHEFIMLVWLPEQGHNTCSYTPSKSVYIPPRVFNDNNYCYCGLEKSDPENTSCDFCGDPLLSLIHASVTQCKIVDGLA
jgi:hypothetical protein